MRATLRIIAATGAAFAMGQADLPADRAEIPAPYRGHWALDVSFCGEPGPANVDIGARTIDFYERHGFVDLAQMNEASDPPTLHASVRWVQDLRFSAGVIRLEGEAGKLFITEGPDPEMPRNSRPWIRCN